MSACTDFAAEGQEEPAAPQTAAASVLSRQQPFARRAGARLDQDMAEAMRKLARIDAVAKSLPGRDCGVCGSPGCGAFAEDVVLDRTSAGRCPYGRHQEEQP